MNNQETQEKVGYRDILRQKEYMKIIVANLINRFGDSIDSIAFTWLVYAATGSAAWTTLIYALNRLPTVLLQPFAGAFVEGMHKKRVMVISDFIRGGAVVFVAIMYMLDSINPLILALFTLTISSVEAFCLPASTALIPKILDKKYFAFGTSLNTTASSVVELIGLGAAGVIIAVFGVQAAIIIDSVTFFLSGLIVAFVKVEEHPQKVATDVKSYFGHMKEGFSYVKKRKIVMNMCLLAVLANAMCVPINSLQSAMAVEIFGVGSELLSVFGIVFTIGMLISTVVFPYLSERIRPRNLVIVPGICLGIVYAMLAFGGFAKGNLLLASIYCGFITFVMAISVSWINATLSVQFMKKVDEDYLARAASLLNASGAAASPVVSFILTGVLVKVSVSSLFFAAGIAVVCIFVGMFMFRVQFDDVDEVGVPEMNEA